ncbi:MULTISPECIES: flagellin [Tritonibacter]|uniref:Flagellin n=1 Tax=Tritonibacter scottomollicae TaxID=483013 RepID=A0A2T1AL98_TRISK|nr:flagellin [Tritonibacter scottomollicae]PRZ49381.1 flagellin [Tritonibacter scottomollicae]WOI32496.1 flagellin [Tritonibacter scottomollicae]
MTSINTNPGAEIALRVLSNNQVEKEDVQDDISTGKEVDKAKDAPAIWAISEIMGSDLAGFEATSNGLNIGEATVAVASAGAEQVTSLLTDMKELTIQAGSGVADYAMIEEQLAQKTEQINTIISSSSFNGVNLLATNADGNGGTGLAVAASQDRAGDNAPTQSTITVDSVDFEGSTSFDINNRTAVTDAASARTALGEIEGFLRYATDGAAALGAGAQQMAEQDVFLDKLSDAVKMGISELTDTDMEDAAARYEALSAQEQLGGLSLSIANASPGSLLSLY